MRALIVRQPWAGLHALGLKVNAAGEIIEFRRRPTNIRERVAVQAAALACSWCNALRKMERVLMSAGGTPWNEEQRKYCLTDMAVLCTVRLVDCRQLDVADLACPGCPDPASEEWLHTYAWVMDDRVQTPVRCKPPRGAQTWFHLPPDVEAEVLRQEALAEDIRA